MTIEAVVALKTLSQSKRRLSAVLNDEQRSGLVEAMARDVLSCLMRHPEIDAVHVVWGEGWTRDVFPEGPLVVWQEAGSHENGLIAASSDHHAVLSPDLTETGTNAVLRWRHQSLPLCFGEDSFSRHQEAAKVSGTPWRVVRAQGVARDVDEPEDLDRLDGNDPDLGETTARWSAVTDINVSMSATHRAC